MNKRFKLLFILALVVLGLFALKPSYNWYYSLTQQERDIANASKESIREQSQIKAAEEADKIFELVKQDPNQEVPGEYDYLIDAAKEKYKEADIELPKEWTLSAVLNSFKSTSDRVQSINNVRAAIEAHYSEIVLGNKDLKKSILNKGLDIAGGMSAVVQIKKESIKIEKEDGTLKTVGELSEEEISDAVNRSLKVLNSRIDEFGLTEPNIRRLGTEQISIEIPGDYDPTKLDSIIRGTGKLNFHIVDWDKTQQLKTFFKTNGHINAPEIVEEGYIALGEYKEDSYGIDQFVGYVVLEAKPGLSGTHIKSAQTFRDNMTGATQVNFTLDEEGGNTFFDFTTENVNNPMAVVMSDKVKSIATIKEPIRSQVSVSGFNIEEARELELILKTAALPVELEIVNMQQVGSGLGEDTIAKGLNAIFVGFLAVMVFMLIYYKGAGLVANVALMLNLFFVMAILATFNMTLTMTSIAGLILNVGMAVDANVIIFERIKEELKAGKSRAQAIKTGFKRAFWTVMDANITTLIAALFLSQVGTGPVKGFAITLAVGIVCSLFTALYVSRFLFDVGTHGLDRSKLSIGWRVK